MNLNRKKDSVNVYDLLSVIVCQDDCLRVSKQILTQEVETCLFFLYTASECSRYLKKKKKNLCSLMRA